MLVDTSGVVGSPSSNPNATPSSSITSPTRSKASLQENLKSSQLPALGMRQQPQKKLPIQPQQPSPRHQDFDKGRLGGEKPRSHDAALPSSQQFDVQARLANTPPHVLIRSISSLSQSSIRPRTPESDPQDDKIGSVPALRKGVLLQARDRLFSRWKERYFVLTRDYLACFRRGTTKYSEMGSFLFKVNLATVDSVGWEDRRGGPVLSIGLPREGKMLLRAKIGLDQWYRELRETTAASRNRRNALRRGSSTTHLNNLSNNNLQMSPQFQSGSGSIPFNLSDSTPEIVQLCESVCRESSPGPVRNISRPNRFSLMTNIEVGSCEGDLTTPPSSVTSSHKFSSSTSSTSGSGGSSSLASSPSLRSSNAWPRPSSPVRSNHMGVSGDPSSSGPPRSRFSLYEGPREAQTMSGAAAKTRHSVCVEPRGLHSDITSVFRRRGAVNHSGSRHSVCLEPSRTTGGGNRGSPLCLQPRNPILELLESSETGKLRPGTAVGPSSPAKSEPETIQAPACRDSVDPSPSPSADHRPRAHSTSVTPERALAPRSRTNLALFRHSAIFN